MGAGWFIEGERSWRAMDLCVLSVIEEIFLSILIKGGSCRENSLERPTCVAWSARAARLAARFILMSFAFMRIGDTVPADDFPSGY